MFYDLYIDIVLNLITDMEEHNTYPFVNCTHQIEGTFFYKVVAGMSSLFSLETMFSKTQNKDMTLLMLLYVFT